MRVYVAGPLGYEGELTPVVRERIEAAEAAGLQLVKAGLSPFVPHSAARWAGASAVSYEAWMTADIEMLEVCEAVLRLPGDSPGAEREEARALELGIPVYRSVAALIGHHPPCHGHPEPPGPEAQPHPPYTLGRAARVMADLDSCRLDISGIIVRLSGLIRDAEDRADA